MANAITLDHYSRPAAELGFIARIRQAFADFRAYTETSSELDALTDRELADIGLTRHNVHDVARQAVYGN